MHILALNTYHGGSHKAFINGWQNNSQLDWTLKTLPDHHWKWRMSHAPITFANELKNIEHEENWDALFCTDMLNLAEFIGLAPDRIQRIPKVIYFHENQLTYPSQNIDCRDLHYAFINFTSALAADEVWFNSAWHRDDFIKALGDWLLRMPDNKPKDEIDAIFAKSKIHPPGINTEAFLNTKTNDKELIILWAARWEHDKNPRCFFNALRLIKQNGIKFKLNVIGFSSKTIPPEFLEAEKEFSEEIIHWGYVNRKTDYIEVLKSSNVVVSTADHEFFGIAIMEAVATGCIPLVPNRLAYPETLAAFTELEDDCFYDGSSQQLAEKLSTYSKNIHNQDWRLARQAIGKKTAAKYDIKLCAKKMDENMLNLVNTFSSID